MKPINGNKIFEFRGDEESVWLSASDQPAAEALFVAMRDDFFESEESVECTELSDEDLNIKFEAEDGTLTTFAELLATDPVPGFVCTTNW